MERKAFIRSIAMLIAAPQIVGELKVIKQIEKPSGFRKCYYFKITEEMNKDISYIEYIFNDKHSFLWRNCERRGINLSEPFDFKVGYDDTDFISNLMTGCITQYSL